MRKTYLKYIEEFLGKASERQLEQILIFLFHFMGT